MAVIAGAFAFTSCEEEIDLGAAKVSFVEPAGLVLNFGPEESSSTVTFVSTRDWNISEVLSNTLPDWIALSATSGEASAKEQSVTVTVMENPGNDRETGVTFTIGLAKATLTVKQEGKLGEVKKGTGTKEDPYTVAGVLEFIETLGADKESDKVYVKGVITSVSTTFEASGTYGNATFYIADAADAEQKFYVFQTYYLGNRKWKSGDTEVKAGDQVIIYGPVVNYKGNTPETVGKGASFIYSLNGISEGGDTGGGQGQTGEAKGAGTEADPFNVAAAIAKAKEVGQTESAQAYYIKGKVAAVAEAFGAQFGNGTFELVDEGFDAVFTAFRILYFGNQKWVEGNKSVNVGDEIVVVGKIVNYKGNTPETSQGSGYLYSLNGDKGTTTPPEEETKATPAGDGSQANPFNVSAAIDKAVATGETATENDFYVKGKVASITEQFAAQFGNGTFVLVDEGYTAKFTAYRILYLNNQKWVEGDATVAVGDEIVAVGKIVNYKGNTPEITQGGYLYSLNGKTSIDQSPVFGVEKTQISVAGSATSAVIKVTGNVAWTATTAIASLTLSPASGQGAGEITATFPANTTESVVTYNLLVKTDADVPTKEIEVMIVQAKASAGGEKVVTFDYNTAEGIEITTTGAEFSSTIDGVTLYLESGARNASNQDIRIYKGKKMTVSAASGAITKIIIKSKGGSNGADKFGTGAPSGYSATATEGTWSGEAASVEFIATDAQVRMTSIEVTVSE